eukprot:TRINITY_DN39147_c0_g1_i1.p1 TRINITY_DN39147_c0_g1~~TRINITY_DN39147_c0_g1_i1.p1  ORF type:complete len:347 (-),score=62.85 TRINITY_DN39147_c0_g1_i1:175-1215(-)
MSACFVDVHSTMFALIFACTLLQAVSAQRRLVVIPDAHGDREVLEAALTLAHVPLVRKAVDEDDLQVLSLGDSVDRGPNPAGCYEALANAQAIRLLGNHEWINLMGVAAEDDPSTPHIQEDLFAPYVSKEDLAGFGGWQNRQIAFSSRGDIGRKIREEFQLVQVLPSPWAKKGVLPPLRAAASLFMHAGIESSLAKKYESAEEMNAQGRAALQQSLNGDDRGLHTELFHEVLQSRYLAYGAEREICSDLRATLAHLGAARLIVGHTPQRSRKAQVRCGGRMVLLDIAMSRWLMKVTKAERQMHPVALEMTYDGPAGQEMLSSLQILYEGDKLDMLASMPSGDGTEL